tara:strand:- start:7106 stop:7681 length:576 start_codon:yes stop_codon:yes gene_type:complete
MAMEFSLKQRMSLVIEANITAEKIVELRDGEIDHEFFMNHNISPTLIRAAKISPLQLKAHGTNTVRKLADLGFNSLHLTDSSWCEGCICAYGASNLLDEFLVSTNDAVVLAASCAVDLLGMNLGILLLMCSRNPNAAREVLVQYKNMSKVPPDTLIETGLRAKELNAIGFNKNVVREDTHASEWQLKLLGF